MCVACLPPSYVAAAVALDQETNGGVKKFEVCDNIDLEIMLMEYESYHYVKFQKYPKLIRRTAEPGKWLLLKRSNTDVVFYTQWDTLTAKFRLTVCFCQYFLLYLFSVKGKPDMEKVVE